jgi:hypothetical protein
MAAGWQKSSLTEIRRTLGLRDSESESWTLQFSEFQLVQSLYYRRVQKIFSRIKVKQLSNTVLLILKSGFWQLVG